MSEVVHRLPNDPVHLWQLNNDIGLYHNPMGCGAFSSAMALSVYQPGGFANNGGYSIAHSIFDRMLQVPISGGTFELQDSLALQAEGVQASMFLLGTFDQLAAAIDLGAPVILLVNRVFLLIGKHDVLMVGYSRDAAGAPLHVFIDDPAIQSPTQPAPAGLSYPGNDKIASSDLQGKWTGTFTPVFKDAATFQEWQQHANRHWILG
jgi:hypothetical protein